MTGFIEPVFSGSDMRCIQARSVRPLELVIVGLGVNRCATRVDGHRPRLAELTERFDSGFSPCPTVLEAPQGESRFSR